MSLFKLETVCLSALQLENGMSHMNSQLIVDSMKTSKNYFYPKVNQSKQLHFITYYNNKNKNVSL